MVIFGGAGDLTKRKLLPALCNLANDHLLPKEFAVVGMAREAISTDDFRQRLTRDIQEFATCPVEPAMWDWFVKRLYYVPGDFRDTEAYRQLQELLTKVDTECGTPGNYLYYLATPPSFFAEIIRQLGAAGLVHEGNGHWRRAIIEKPFGRDLDSARALNKDVGAVLQESQIYRIDHVQITVAESVGVERRGSYYEETGALRDMVPNHLFQLLALTAMEPPISFAADAVRDESGKILHAIPPMTPEDVLTRTVRGQYGEGMEGDHRVPAYRSEADVKSDSATETFVAMKLFIDNWR